MSKVRDHFSAIWIGGINKVLVAGGFNTGDGNLDVAEIYDPSGGSWTLTTGAMNFKRDAYGMALLSDNKVLIAGGASRGPVLKLAEIYDPNTGKFTATGPMNVERWGYQGTMLVPLAPATTGGVFSVLIAGGNSSTNSPLSTAEVFNPTTGIWSNTSGNMTVARSNHTLTRLQSGKVLVVGGTDQSAELFNPTNNNFTRTAGFPNVARQFHSAVLLYNGKVLIAGGRINGATTASTELYDPVTDTFSVSGNMKSAREEFTLVRLLNGRVLAAGGYIYPAGNRLNTAEEYNPATGTWVDTLNMTVARSQYAAVLLNNGKVLIAGGYGSEYLKTAELYTPDPVVTTTTLTANTNPTPPNHNVIFTATVAYENLVPTGNVIFKLDNATTATATVTLSGGKAYYQNNTLTAGTHTLKAEYNGNTIYKASSSTVLTHTVQASVLDFVVTGVTLTPATPVANETFTAAVTVKNQGLTSGDGGNLTVWANQAAAQACNATGLPTKPVGTLAAGATTTLTFSGIPVGTTSGAKTLRAFVDNACTVVETDDTNNQFTKPYRATIAASGKPDFVIESIINTPINPMPNSNFDAVVTIKNQGNTAGSPGTFAVWTDKSVAATCNEAGSSGSGTIPSLEAGGMYIATANNLKMSTAGAKTLRAFIDFKCATTEPNETNNQLTKSYTVVDQPDFVVTNIVLTPTNPLPGTTFDAAVTVKNQGTKAGAGEFLDVWTNKDTEVFCGVEGDMYKEVGSLAPAETKTITFNGLNAGTGGSKSFRAFVDSWCATPEALDSNNQFKMYYHVPAPSCKAIKVANATYASGKYKLDPDGAGPIAAFDAYCDMTTDGGGWTLVLAYKHTGGQNNALVLGVPTDPNAGYAHMRNSKMQELSPYNEARFYCTTSVHTRIMHFKTNHPGVLGYIKTSNANDPKYWNSGYTVLDRHTANLPGSTTHPTFRTHLLSHAYIS
jgi:hypothetical protein